jgi:hypothetical protein
MMQKMTVEAWREARLQEFSLQYGGVIRYRVADVLALLDEQGNAPNPLMAIIADHTKGTPSAAQARQTGAEIMTDPAKRGELRAMLNDIMVRLVVWPPLVEQGHEDGVSVDEFTIEEKMDIFTGLLGGQQRLDAASNFRPQPTGSLVAPLAGEGLRDEAEPPVEPD